MGMYAFSFLSFGVKNRQPEQNLYLYETVCQAKALLASNAEVFRLFVTVFPGIFREKYYIIYCLLKEAKP